MTETATDTGATPGAGAMPAQSGQSSAGATPQTPPATDDEALGEAGKAILRQARAAARDANARATAAEQERDALKASSLTDSQKEVAKARKEGAAEATGKLMVQIRRSGVKAALAAAGVNSELLDLATKADEFEDLKVDDDGEIEGLDGAITALRKARPSLFGKAGDFGGGNRGATPETPKDMNALLRAATGH